MADKRPVNDAEKKKALRRIWRVLDKNGVSKESRELIEGASAEKINKLAEHFENVVNKAVDDIIEKNADLLAKGSDK